MSDTDSGEAAAHDAEAAAHDAGDTAHDAGDTAGMNEESMEWHPKAAGETPRALARLLGLPRIDGDEVVALLDQRVESDLAIEEFSYDSEPGENVTGILARPMGREATLPAILCLHDLHQGRKTTMGEKFHFDDRLGWLRGWGRELARHGFVTAGITLRTFGKRPGEIEEQSRIEMVNGRTMMGAFAWETMQAIEMLARRADVDESRIGIMGVGLGGAIAFYTAALDDRLKAIVTAAAGIGSIDLFTRWGDVNAHDLSWFIPGILEKFDHPEIVSSLAPRSYLLLTRDADPSMPLEGVRRAEWEGGARYRELAMEERLKVSIRPGAHEFNADELDEAVQWFTQWLSPESARAFHLP